MALSETEKARRYEQRAPGLDIPVEQKAERYERYEVKDRMAGLSRVRGRVIQHSLVVGGTCWCDDCGKFKHEGPCA